MVKRYEMRFGGSGGQGMMLMGDILAEAIGILGGKEILLTKSYGPEARGGACRSELAISDEVIRYPVITRPDFMLAMSQQACDKYCSDLNYNALLLVDSEFVYNVPKIKGIVYSLPLTKISINSVGQALNANIVALGAISVLAQYTCVENVRQCVLSHFAEKFREKNICAFEAGVQAAQALK